MWLIPGKTKVSLEIFKGVGIIDILMCIFSGILLLLLVISNLPFVTKVVLASIIAVITILLIIRIDDEPNYVFFLHILKYFEYSRHYLRAQSDRQLVLKVSDGEKESALYAAFEENNYREETKEQRKARLKAEKKEYKEDNLRLKSKDITKEESDAIWLKRAQQSAARKKAKKELKDSQADWGDMADIISFTGIKDDFIEFGGEYFGAVIEIPQVEFRFFGKYRRANTIQNGIGAVLGMIHQDYAANIIKIERPVHYEKYVENEHKKIDDLKKSFENGMISEGEFKSRVAIVLDRINELQNYIDEDKVIVPYFYLVLYDSDRKQLENSVSTAMDSLIRGEMKPKRLKSKEIAVFLKYTNQLDFDEDEIDKIAPEDYATWAMPDQLDVRVRSVEINKIVSYTMRVISYSMLVDDAWMASVMSIPATKCVVKCKPMDRQKAIRNIDKSLSELRAQYMSTSVDSKLLELQSHIDSLGGLLNTLQGDNETLLEMNFYVTAYDIVTTNLSQGEGHNIKSNLPNISNMKKTIKRMYRENNMKLTGQDFEQLQAFLASQVSGYDPFAKRGRGVPSSSIAAGYPWVFANLSDEKGIKLGSSDGVPVFIDFFRRDSERVNSNMVIVGKSGSGKSYATKSLLTNLAADDSKIFILDPENEYTEMAQNLHGKFINVGNAIYGRLNPFHIITALDDDDTDEGSVAGSYSTHLQFLEEFFKQILPDCDKDAMEYLNLIIDRMYTNMGITPETDLSKLKPDDYPIFDDLYDAILQEFQQTDNEYIRTMLRTLMNYIAKFSTGGRNANIWNGPSTITTEENFCVFNFQSLLANRNGLIANAQMLLVLKYIDNEIIKNRDYNTKFKMNRKIIVVIDEAHVFIDSKFPVALDFMFQLAKRIRKYNGMQIVITQNIKDFVGSEELARKSTAIINACQYSFIFSLSPNDMDDLCKLYEKAGGINEAEQEQIITAGRGQVFTVTGPSSRSSFKIEVPEDVVALFSDREYEGTHFVGEEGEDVWERFVGESREKHELSRMQKKTEDIEKEEEDNRRSFVTFEEFSEDEYEEYENNIKPYDKKSTGIEFETVDENEYDYDENMDLYSDEEDENELVTQYSEPAKAETVQGDSNVEKMLTQLLGTFSHDTMLSEIQRTVESEVERRVRDVLDDIIPEGIGFKRNDNELLTGEDFEEEYENEDFEEEYENEDFEEEYENEDFNEEYENEGFDELFANEYLGEKDEDVLPEDELDIKLTEDEPEKDNTDFESDELPTGAIDIMAILRAEAEKIGTTSNIEQMELYDESVIDITIEDLALYIKNTNAY